VSEYFCEGQAGGEGEELDLFGRLGKEGGTLEAAVN